MTQVTAFCQEAKGLKLGPGTGSEQTPGKLIVFSNGYATFDTEDFPDFDQWRIGAPPIEVLDESAGEVAATDTAEFVCEIDGKAFETKAKLNGHRMSHAPKKAKAPKA